MACKAATSPSLSARLHTSLNAHWYQGGRRYSSLASIKGICAAAESDRCVKGSTVRRYRQSFNTTSCIAGSSHTPLTHPKPPVDSFDPSVTDFLQLSPDHQTPYPSNHIEQKDQLPKEESNDPIGGRFLFHPFRGGKVLSRSIKSLVSETGSGARWSDPGYVYPSLVRGRTAGAANLAKSAAKSESLGVENSSKGDFELVDTGAGRNGSSADRNGLESRLGTVETGSEATRNGGFGGATGDVGHREWDLEEASKVEGQNEKLHGKGGKRPPLWETKRTVGEWEPYSFSRESSAPEGPMDLLDIAEGLLGSRQNSPADPKLRTAGFTTSTRERNRNGGLLSQDGRLDYSGRADEGSSNPPSTSYSRSEPHSDFWSFKTRPVGVSGVGAATKGQTVLQRRGEENAGKTKSNWGELSKGDGLQLGNKSGLRQGRPENGAHGRTNDVWKREGKTLLGAFPKPNERRASYQGEFGSEQVSSAGTETGFGTGLEANGGLDTGLETGLEAGLERGSETGLETGLETGFGERKGVSALDDELGRFVQRLSKVGSDTRVSGSSAEGQSKTSAPNRVPESQPFSGLNSESNLFSSPDLGVDSPVFGNPRNLAVVREGNLKSARSCETRSFVEKLKVGGESNQTEIDRLTHTEPLEPERAGRRKLGRAETHDLKGVENRRLQRGGQSVMSRADGAELGVAENGALLAAAGGELERAGKEAHLATVRDELEWAKSEALPATSEGKRGWGKSEAQPATAGVELDWAKDGAQPTTTMGELDWTEDGELPATAFYDENFLERFRYTRPPPNRNLPLFMDIRNHWTAPEDPMPPSFYPKNCTHEKSGPLPGYPHGRVPRPKPPGPLLHGKRPDFWVVNPNNNRLVVPRAIKAAPRGKLPGVKKLLEGWTGRGCMTREESLGAPLMEDEVVELIDGAVRERKEVYLGRDGLTWNMVQLIHTHWRRRPVCKIKCKGIYTVDMPKIMRELERCAGGHVIWQHGGTVLLFRGRNYHWKQPPILELPVDRSAEKKLTQADNQMEDRNPGGMGKWESLQLSKRMNREDPVVWLDKIGYYGGLVHQLRTFFSAPQNDLAVIKCPGFVTGDVVKLALQLKALVPATVFQCDKERKQRIVLYRNPDWRCPDDDFARLAETDLRPTYNPKPLTPKPKLRRTVMYENLASVAAEEENEGVWVSWSGLFEPLSDEQSSRSNV